MNDEIRQIFEPISPLAQAKAGLEFGDEPLRPYGASRKVAAQRMGLLYPFVGESGQRQMQATGMYPGAQQDVIIVLWLCSLKDASEFTAADVKEKAWNPSKALNNPTGAMDAAIVWAASKGIDDIYSDEWKTALETFFEIVVPPELAKFKVEGESGKAEPDDGPKV